MPVTDHGIEQEHDADNQKSGGLKPGGFLGRIWRGLRRFCCIYIPLHGCILRSNPPVREVLPCVALLGDALMISDVLPQCADGPLFAAYRGFEFPVEPCEQWLIVCLECGQLLGSEINQLFEDQRNLRFQLFVYGTSGHAVITMSNRGAKVSFGRS